MLIDLKRTEFYNNSAVNTHKKQNFGAKNYWEITKNENQGSIWDMSFFSPNYFTQINYQDKTDITLKNDYNITVEIGNPILLNKITDAVKDYCNLNCNNEAEKKELFNGLKIDDKANMPEDKVYYTEINPAKNEFTLHFNHNFNWNNIESFTQNQYDDAKICTNNKNYYPYKGLAEFLNYNNNQNQREVLAINKNNFIKMLKLCNYSIDNSLIDNIRCLDGDDAVFLMKDKFQNYDFDKLLEPLNLQEGSAVFVQEECPEIFDDFNSSYIAAKMCSENLIDAYNEIYNPIGGNPKLKFPKPNTPIEKKDEIKFNSVNKAQKYLKKYGINADFDGDLDYANACVNAVEILTKAINNPKIFDRLQIEPCYDLKRPFLKYTSIRTRSKFDKKTQQHIGIIELAPEHIPNKQLKGTFQQGIISSDNLTGQFIHELTHYIDFKSNPQGHHLMACNTHIDMNSTREDRIEKRKNGFTPEAIRITSFVSRYATQEPGEFVAEYVAGRLTGNKYPKAVDEIFSFLWNTDNKHPKIEFPE